MAKHIFTGVFIPAKIWISKDLIPQEKMILAEIRALSEDSGWCYANNKHFSDWLGCLPTNVSNYIQKFQKFGMVEVKYDNLKTFYGRKMRVNLDWYHGLQDPVPPSIPAVPPSIPAVPPSIPAVPPSIPAVTERQFKNTYILNERGDTPTPEPQNLKEEKKETREVAPGRAETVEAQNPPLPKVAPKGIPPAGNYEPSEFDIYGLQPLEILEGDVCPDCSGRGNCTACGEWRVNGTGEPTHVVTEINPTAPSVRTVTGLHVSEPVTKTVSFPQNYGPGQPQSEKPPRKSTLSAPNPHEENQEVFTYFDSPEKIGAAWRKWITEKWGQHRCKFKTAESEKIALKQLWELSGGKSDTAEKIIDQSIANTWKGLFALKIQNNGTKPTIADRRKQATADMLRHVVEFGLG